MTDQYTCSGGIVISILVSLFNVFSFSFNKETEYGTLKNSIVSLDTITSLFSMPLWRKVILLYTNGSHQLNKQVNIRLKLKVLPGILYPFSDCPEC